MSFIIKKRFPRFEIREGQTFPDQQTAEKFILEKLEEDIRLKVTATYSLYENEHMDPIKEFTQRDVVPTTSSDVESSSQQQGSREVFSPSPLSTSPRPGGMPQNWKMVKEEDQKKS